MFIRREINECGRAGFEEQETDDERNDPKMWEIGICKRAVGQCWIVLKSWKSIKARVRAQLSLVRYVPEVT